MVRKNYFDLSIDKCAQRWYTGVKLVNGIHFLAVRVGIGLL